MLLFKKSYLNLINFEHITRIFMYLLWRKMCSFILFIYFSWKHGQFEAQKRVLYWFQLFSLFRLFQITKQCRKKSPHPQNNKHIKIRLHTLPTFTLGILIFMLFLQFLQVSFLFSSITNFFVVSFNNSKCNEDIFSIVKGVNSASTLKHQQREFYDFYCMQIEIIFWKYLLRCSLKNKK